MDSGNNRKQGGGGWRAAAAPWCLALCLAAAPAALHAQAEARDAAATGSGITPKITVLAAPEPGVGAAIAWGLLHERAELPVVEVGATWLSGFGVLLSAGVGGNLRLAGPLYVGGGVGLFGYAGPLATLRMGLLHRETGTRFEVELLDDPVIVVSWGIARIR